MKTKTSNALFIKLEVYVEDVVRRFITTKIRTDQTNFECQSTSTGSDSISPESRWTLATFGVVILHNHLRKKAYISSIRRKKDACKIMKKRTKRITYNTSRESRATSGFFPTTSVVDCTPQGPCSCFGIQMCEGEFIF